MPDIGVNDPQAEVKKILYQAQVQLAAARLQARDDAAKALAAADADREKAAWANEYAHQQAVDGAYLDVTKGAIDRAQARAQFIQTAAASIATAYAAILALSFKVDGTSPSAGPLPVQGVIPTVFLGLAIVLATVYLGYIGRQRAAPGPEAGASLGANQAARLNAFIGWASALVLPRVYFLHASVVSLALGVGLLPLAYLQVPSAAALGVAVGGLAVVFAVPMVARGRSDQPA